MSKKTNSLRIVISAVILLIIIIGVSLFVIFNNDDNKGDTQSGNNTAVSEQSDFSKQDAESSLPAQTESSGFTSASSDDPTDQSSNSSEEQSSDTSDDKSTTTSDSDIHQHTFGNWNTLKTASCTANGNKQRTCSTCGFVQNSTISALGHTYDSGTVIEEAKSCTDTGKVRYTCTVCGSQYIAATRGKHQFIRGGEYNRTITCTLCDEMFSDEFSATKNDFITIDENSALVNDRIRLKQPNYVGKLSTWSEKWIEYRNVILLCMSERSINHLYGAPCDVYPYILDHTISNETDAKKVQDEFILFLDDFEDVFGWRPVEPTVGYYHDPWTDAYCLNFDINKTYSAYISQIRNLSKEQIEQIEKDVAAYLVHSYHIYDGMSVYNASSMIAEVLWTWTCYDWSLQLHNAIDGFALGSCVCDGQSKMFIRLAEYCNINAEMVIGTMKGQGHAWVKITFSDGTVRYIDPTNDTWLRRSDNMEEYAW